ncbi:MAG: DsbA family oxidoreductase [Pseudomonadota bacterium]
MIPLDIISDPICPWCLIGKTRLDRAIEQVGHNPFTPRWRMFRLNPEMPAEGMDRRGYLEAKFGGPAGAERVYGHIAEVAAADGLDLALDAIGRTPQTLNAHRLIRWAEQDDRQQDVVDALFERYFRRGQDISDAAVLTDVARSAGMDAAVVARLLDGDADRDALVEEEDAARKMGVTGVPCYIIDGKYVVQGAQDTATWVRIIEEIGTALSDGAADEEPDAEQAPTEVQP